VPLVDLPHMNYPLSQADLTDNYKPASDYPVLIFTLGNTAVLRS